MPHRDDPPVSRKRALLLEDYGNDPDPKRRQQQETRKAHNRTTPNIQQPMPTTRTNASLSTRTSHFPQSAQSATNTQGLRAEQSPDDELEEGEIDERRVSTNPSLATRQQAMLGPGDSSGSKHLAVESDGPLTTTPNAAQPPRPAPKTPSQRADSLKQGPRAIKSEPKDTGDTSESTPRATTPNGNPISTNNTQSPGIDPVKSYASDLGRFQHQDFTECVGTVRLTRGVLYLRAISNLGDLRIYRYVPSDMRDDFPESPLNASTDLLDHLANLSDVFHGEYKQAWPFVRLAVMNRNYDTEAVLCARDLEAAYHLGREGNGWREERLRCKQQMALKWDKTPDVRRSLESQEAQDTKHAVPGPAQDMHNQLRNHDDRKHVDERRGLQAGHSSDAPAADLATADPVWFRLYIANLKLSRKWEMPGL
ncbi:hypothetical protein LTR15_006102 [Elasticomyces elasticus]|nr:hypothetical protein LTR15_006102 [Elasticomyces elasticus]